MLHSLDDSGLITKIQSGDRMAFQELYNRYYKVVHGHAYLLLQDSDAAKDIMQDVFLAIWLKRETLRINTNVRNYLITMAANEVYDRKKAGERQMKAESESGHVISIGTVLDKMEAGETEMKIRMAIRSFPYESMKQAFRLHLNGMPHEDIAHKLNITIGSSHAIISKAKKLIATFLKKKSGF